MSPTTNPGYPENPVNGAADATTGSTLVDFLPYRNGPQSDPDTGQFPVVPAPIPVSDAPPAVTVAAERATYRRGDTVLLTATPSDDFGIRQVTFFDGADGGRQRHLAAVHGRLHAGGATRPAAPTRSPPLPRTRSVQTTTGDRDASPSTAADGPGGTAQPLTPPTVKLPRER